MRERLYLLTAALILFVSLAGSVALALNPITPYEVYVFDDRDERWIEEGEIPYRSPTPFKALFCIHRNLNESLVIAYATEGYMAFAELFADYRRLNLCEWTEYESILASDHVNTLNIVHEVNTFIGPEDEGEAVAIIEAYIITGPYDPGSERYFAIPLSRIHESYRVPMSTFQEIYGRND